MDEDNSNYGWVIWALIIGFFLFFHKDTYEDQTAEEWFNEYDAVEADYENFHSCVSDEAEGYLYEYEDYVDAIDNIQSCLYNYSP